MSFFQFIGFSVDLPPYDFTHGLVENFPYRTWEKTPYHLTENYPYREW